MPHNIASSVPSTHDSIRELAITNNKIKGLTKERDDLAVRCERMTRALRLIVKNGLETPRSCTVKIARDALENL